MPRSTMLTGISGSRTSRSASSRRLSGTGVRPPELVELLLQGRYHLVVARPAGAPAAHDGVPVARVGEVPAPGLGVEGAGEGVVEDPLLALVVGWHPDADLLAVGHDQREPPLAELVVGLALEAVVELGG